MSVIKVGDKVRRLHDDHRGVSEGQIAMVTGEGPGTNVRLNGDVGGSHKLKNLELVEAKPTYPNPPHKHAELIKAWADGAEVEFLNLNSIWKPMSFKTINFVTDEHRQFRIKPTKSDKEIQIEKLEEQAKQLAKDIAKLKESS